MLVCVQFVTKYLPGDGTTAMSGRPSRSRSSPGSHRRAMPDRVQQ
jgi:hypothetical protein